MVLSDGGIGFDGSPSAHIGFVGRLKTNRLLTVEPGSATYSIAPLMGGPTKLRVDRFRPEFDLYFPEGIILISKGSKAPVLTWSEASAGPGVPTPESQWITLSIDSALPPVMLTFLDKPCSLIADGRQAGGWVVRAEQPSYAGWVRLSLPMKNAPSGPIEPAALALVAKSSIESAALVARPFPEYKWIEGRMQDGKVVARFVFDKPLSILPEWMKPLLYEESTVPPEGTDYFDIALPVPEWTIGRAVVARPDGALIRMSAANREAAVLAAFQMLFADTNAEIGKNLKTAESRMVGEQVVKLDTWTRARLPYGADGAGTLELAVLNLIRFAIGPDPNPYWTTLVWGQDPLDGSWPYGDRQKVGGLASLASLFDSTTSTQVRAALFRSSLSPEQAGLPLAGVFGSAESQVLQAIRSPLRLVSGPTLFARNISSGYELRWAANQAGKATMILVFPSTPRVVTVTGLDSATVTPLWSTKGGGVGVEVQAICPKPGLARILFKSTEVPLPAIPRGLDWSRITIPSLR